MEKKEVVSSFVISALITLLFFYKVIFGLVPFPGDLLVAEAKPWSTYSYGGYLPSTVPNKAQYPDVIRQLYPWRILAIDQMKKGEAPLWNPYNFSGSPLLANFQSAPYYPLNILFWILQPIDAWTVLVILQPLLAMWFTYLFLRKLKLHPLASWFGALSYSFSAFSTVLVEYNTIGHVTLWLPLVLLAVENLRQRIRASWLGIFVCSLTFAALAGHPQVFAYLLFGTWCYSFSRMKKKSFLVIAFSLISLGIAAIQYAPGIELIQNAARSKHEAWEIINKLLIQPWQLLMLPFPNIFGNPATRSYWPSDTFASKVTSIGLVPLFFLPAFWRKRQTIHAKFFLVAAILLLLFVTRNPVSGVLAQFNIPLWSTSNPTLMVFLLSFFLSAAVAIGVDAWMVEKHTVKRLTKRVVSVLIFFSFVVVSLLIAQRLLSNPWPQRLHVATRAMYYATALSVALCAAFVAAVMRPKLIKLALIFLLVVHTADLWWMFQRFNPFSPKAFVYPPAPVIEFLKEKSGYDRFWGYGTAAIGANIATQLRLFSPDGYDPLYPKWYGEFISSSQKGVMEQAARSDAMIVPGFGEEDLSNNVNRLKVLDFLGVVYILDRTENASTLVTFPPSRFDLIYEQDGWKVFENLAAAPRAFLTPESAGSTVEITSYKPNDIEIKTKAVVQSTLFLSDTYYPGWKAYVDGEEKPILKSAHAFRSVVVPEGEHTVLFLYEPPSFSLGVKISIVSLLIVSGTLMIVSRKSHA